MKKNIIQLAIFFSTSFAIAQQPIRTEAPTQLGFFPYENSLKNTQNDTNLEVQGSASKTEDGILLTPDVTNQFGGLFLENTSFTSAHGIVIEFEYNMTDGTMSSRGRYGDGLAFFLYDGSVPNKQIGAQGAALGYTYRRFPEIPTNINDVRRPGLSGGYLGIGLDEYGNFSAGMRVPGFRLTGPAPHDYGNYSTSYVTLRGARGGKLNDLGMDDGYTGYPVLISRKTDSNDISNSRYSRVLNINDGTYTNMDNVITEPFKIRNSNSPEEIEYRKVLLHLIPHFNTDRTQNNGYDIKVDFQTEVNGPNINVIDYFHYPKLIKYPENLIPTTSELIGEGGPFYEEIFDLNTTPPENIKVGFAAGTGSATQKHMIKNLKIYLPFTAQAKDVTVETCANRAIVFDPLINSSAHTGVVSINPPPEANVNYIDKTQFSFARESATDMGIYHEKNTANGIWRYDETRGTVTFFPSENFNGNATMEFTVKGKNKYNENILIEPYGDAAYRSFPATLTVNLKTEQCNREFDGIKTSIISNKMVTQGIK